VAIAEADPADARGQSLEADALAGHVEPVHADADYRAASVRAPWRRSLRCLPDRRTSAAQRNGPDAPAEERTYIGGHEAREIEAFSRPRPLRPGGCCCRSRRWACPSSRRRAWLRRARGSTRAALSTDFGADAMRASQSATVQPFGQIAVDGVMSGRLVGDHVGLHAPSHEFGIDVGGVAEQADGERLLLRAGFLDHCERFIERFGRGVEVPVSRRFSMRLWRHSTASIDAPAIVAANVCAPPMPPRPAVRIHLPERSPP
jgi:hypothetical protein